MKSMALLLRQVAEELLHSAEPGPETNTAQLYRALSLKFPCAAPARMVCGSDNTCVASECSNVVAEYIEQPLEPLRGDYSAAMHAYVLHSRTLARAIESVAKALALDAHLPLDGITCRSRIGCNREKSYIIGSVSYRFNTLRPRIIVPTVLGYRVIRATRHLDNLSLPWLIVKEHNTCTSFICFRKNCTATIGPESLEFSDEPLVKKGHQCSKRRVIGDALFALLQGQGLSAHPEGEPRFYLLGAPLLVATAPLNHGQEDRRENALSLVLWNPVGITTHASIIFSAERVLAAHVVHPDGVVEHVEPEYDRVTFPIRAHGLVELQLRTRRLPRLLLAGNMAGRRGH